MIRLATTHNLLTGRFKKHVREGIDEILAEGDVVVAFQEAQTYLAIIRDLAKAHGYRVVISADKGRGMKSSVLLVKKTAEILDTGVAHSRWAWVGPRMGIRWPGRSIPWAIVDVGDETVLFACVHAPTGRNGNPLNRRSFCRFMRRLRKLYKKKLRVHPGLKFFFLGDWNCAEKDKGIRSVQNLLVKRLKALVANPHCTPPIDYAVHNLEERVLATQGPSYGSDHDSGIFVLAA